MAATKMSAPRRTTAEKQERRARPTSLVINWVQSTTLIASRCGGQVVQMHSWGASASRPSGGGHKTRSRSMNESVSVSVSVSITLTLALSHSTRKHRFASTALRRAAAPRAADRDVLLTATHC